MALFSRTGGADFPDKLKVLVTGPPKSGKTTLLGTVPNIVIADTEPQANNLQSIAHLDLPYVTVNGTPDLMNLRMVLEQDALREQAAQSLGMPKIEAVAIDTLDTLQKIMKRERMAEQRTTKFLRDDWGWLKEEMGKLVEAFTALPLHVFFIVHTKTKDIGNETNPQTIILPGLEGSIAEDIAGMVGYSLLSFRKQEIRSDGTPFTKYWLRAEGDETYNFLGNRTAGRLPDVIEPSFKAIYDAAMAGRPQQQAQAPVAMPTGQPQVQAPVQIPTAPAAPAVVSAPATQPVTNVTNVNAAPAQPQAAPQAAPQEPDDAPVNAAALVHIKKIYDALGAGFPEDKLKQLSLGDARDLVRMWTAVQQDHMAGNGDHGSPQAEMLVYLGSMEWLTDEDQQRQEASEQPEEEVGSDPQATPAPVSGQESQAPASSPAPAQVEAKIDGTINEVMAYVGDSLERAQQAYDLEVQRKSPRGTLINQLENKGAKPPAPTPTVTPEQPQQTPAEVPTDVQNDGAKITPETPAEPVTQPPAAADVPPTEEQAVETVSEVLGGSVLATEEDERSKPCDACGNPVDDLDIARLGVGRFKKWLCVQDYIAATKIPQTA